MGPGWFGHQLPSSAGLFLDSLYLPRACFWTLFVFRGLVFTLPLSSAGVSLDRLSFVGLFWIPLSSSAGMFLGSLCLPPRSCFCTLFVFHFLSLCSFGLFLGARFWTSGLVFGPPLGSFLDILRLPGARFGPSGFRVSFLEFLWLPGARSWTFCMRLPARELRPGLPCDRRKY